MFHICVHVYVCVCVDVHVHIYIAIVCTYVHAGVFECACVVFVCVLSAT